MPIAVRQSNKSNTGGSANPGASFGSLPLAGSLVYVHITSYLNAGTTPTITGVADNQGVGNTYSLVASQVTTAGSDNYRHEVWLCQIIGATSGTFTVTVTFSSSVSTFITIVELTGQATTGQPHKQVNGTGSSAAPSQTLPATTVANCIILGGMTHNNGTPTITPDGTNLPNQLQEEEDNNSTEAGNVAYRAVSATGTYTGSWALSASSTWAVIVIAIAEAAAGAQDTPETRGRPYGAIGFRQQTQLLSR